MHRLVDHSDGNYKTPFRILLILCWIFAFSSFNLPGRIGPPNIASLDWVAFFKIGSRIISFSMLIVLLFMIRHSNRLKAVFTPLVPFGLFGLWAILSAIWSPLKTISLGHGGELLMMLLFSGIIGVTCYNNERLSILLLNISLIIFLFILLSVIIHYRYPSSLLDFANRPDALGHPNDVSGSAGLGLILISLCISVWRWRWAIYLMIPAFLVECLFLLLARSRVALAATTITLLLGFVIFQKRVILSFSMLLISIFGTVIIITSGVVPIQKSISDYIMRGQEKIEFLSGSGRIELWSIGIKSFLDSPLIGNGYYAISPTGLVDLGNEERPIGTHNIFIHVLAGTGLVGAVLFGLGFLWPLAIISRAAFTQNPKDKNLAIFILIFFGWFFLVGLFELAFLGPIRISAVLFYILLGIGMRLPWRSCEGLTGSLVTTHRDTLSLR